MTAPMTTNPTPPRDDAPELDAAIAWLKNANDCNRYSLAYMAESAGSTDVDKDHMETLLKAIASGDLVRRADLAPASAGMVAVMVKPLVWVERDDIPNLINAESAIGWWYNILIEGGVFRYDGDPAVLPAVPRVFPTLSAAKAAAQADYEARILAALSQPEAQEPKCAGCGGEPHAGVRVIDDSRWCRPVTPHAAQVTVAEADYSSLVERLRSTSSRCHLAIAWKAMDEAADAIIALQGERDRQYDENANRIAAQAKAEAALARAIPADGSTIEAMRAALLDTPAGKSLNSKGDVRIYWLNEGDVNTAALRALTGEGRADGW